MSLHITYNHECPQCGAYYVPYDSDVACPQCGLVEKERFRDFIPRAAQSAKYNFDSYGRFIPAGWAVTCFADHVLQLLFGILQEYMEDSSKRLFPIVARERVQLIDWGSQKYAMEHLFGMVLRVFEELGSPAHYAVPTGFAEVTQAVGSVEFKPNPAELFDRLSQLFRLIPGSVRWRADAAMSERALRRLLVFGFKKPFFKRTQDFIAESLLASPHIFCALALEILLTEFSVRERQIYWDGGGCRTDLAERMESWSLIVDGIGLDHVGGGISIIFAIPDIEHRLGDFLEPAT